MKKIALISTLLLLLLGCSTPRGGDGGLQAEESLLSLLSLRTYPSNVYVGVSGPYSTQERMVQEAILASAKSILLEQALALDNKTVMQSSSSKGLISFAEQGKAYYDDQSLKEVVDRLKILSIHFDAQGGAVVFVQDPTAVAGQRSYQAEVPLGKAPKWLVELPKVAGYRFGIGSSKAYYFLNDSLEASDFAAAQNLLDLSTEHLFSKGLTVTRDGSGSSMDNVLYQAQRGLLQGFTIVDRYYDKESDTYWSLASITE